MSASSQRSTVGARRAVAGGWALPAPRARRCAACSPRRTDPRAHPYPRRCGCLHLAGGRCRKLAPARCSRPRCASGARQLAVAPERQRRRPSRPIEERINHDVKAVEYYLREQLTAVGARMRPSSWCTSAAPRKTSTTSVTRACCTRRARRSSARSRPARVELKALAHRYADTAMPARTHGQPASPTTLGKEFANFVARLRRAQRRFAAVSILASGMVRVGNFNAPRLRRCRGWTGRPFPGVRHPSLSLEYNPWTTRIEPHDWIAEY